MIDLLNDRFLSDLIYVAIVGGVSIFQHLVGDFPLQNTYQAVNKRLSLRVAFDHGLWYSLPFWILFWPQPERIVWVIITHVLIDHLNVASKWFFYWNLTLKEKFQPSKLKEVWSGHPDARLTDLVVKLGSDKFFTVCLHIDQTFHLSLQFLILTWPGLLSALVFIWHYLGAS